MAGYWRTTTRYDGDNGRIYEVERNSEGRTRSYDVRVNRRFLAGGFKTEGAARRAVEQAEAIYAANGAKEN